MAGMKVEDRDGLRGEKPERVRLTRFYALDESNTRKESACI